MSGDGRLDLDELGSVIEGARSIDEPAADVLGEDPGRTWGERLEGAGITPFVRRHRAALAAGTAAVVLLGVGGWAWLRAQPPPWRTPEITAIAATLDDSVGTSLRTSDGDTVAGAYLLSADDPGTTVALDGIEGPGIRTSTVGAPLPSGNPKASVVRAVIGCDDRALGADRAAYRLRVTATDAWGRSAVSYVETPVDGLGYSGFGWREIVGQTCWQQAISTQVAVSSVAADPDPGAGAVNLRIGLASRLPVDARASLDYTDDGITGVAPLPDAQLARGAETSLTGRLDVHDCTGGAPPVPQITVPIDPANPNAYHAVEGLNLAVFAPDLQTWGTTPIGFTPQQRADLARALASVCRGAPQVSTGSDVQVVRTIPDPSQSLMTFVLVLPVAVPSDRLAQVSVARDPSFGTGDPASAAWTLLPRGGGRAEVSWTFTCDVAPMPPALDVRFVDGVRATPVRVPIDRKPLVPVLLSECPTLTRQVLQDYSWFVGAAGGRG